MLYCMHREKLAWDLEGIRDKITHWHSLCSLDKQYACLFALSNL